MTRRLQPGKLQSMWCLGMVAVSALALQGCTTNPVHSYYYGNSAGGMSRTDLIEVNERATDALLLLNAPLDPSQPVLVATLVNVDRLNESSRLGRIFRSRSRGAWCSAGCV